MHVKLNTECLDELKWWVHYLKSDIKKMLHSPAITAEIYTDTSFEGFGSSWNGREFQGIFTEKQKELSINTKELLTIYYTLRVQVEELKGQVVLFCCDNTTALFCMKSLGSRDVLRDRITSKIYHLAHLYNVTLRCSYVNTKFNKSDCASRVFKQKSVNTKWSLHETDFQKVLSLATIPPDVDMFASEANKKLPQFILWHPCKDAMHIDMFTYNWGTFRGFLFAPFHCLASVLKKCLDDEVENMCGVFPLWLTKMWWPTLMRLSRGNIVQLKGAGQRLALPWDPQVTHPMGSHLKLIFANLSMNSYSAEKFQNLRLPTSLKMPGVKVHTGRKCPHCNNGLHSPKKRGRMFTNWELGIFSYNMLKRGAALLRLLRCLIGKPVSKDDNYIIDKVMQATFNTHPPKIKELNWTQNVWLQRPRLWPKIARKLFQ